MMDYRTGSTSANYSRPTPSSLSTSKRPLISRTASVDGKSERIYRSSSLQRPSNYLPTFDHI